MTRDRTAILITAAAIWIVTLALISPPFIVATVTTGLVLGVVLAITRDAPEEPPAFDTSNVIELYGNDEPPECEICWRDWHSRKCLRPELAAPPRPGPRPRGTTT